MSSLQRVGWRNGRGCSVPSSRAHRLRNAFTSWEEVPGAVGYNILWGLTTEQGDKLYQCYQVFADQRPTLELRALNIDQPYSFAIEAFNESGVSKASKVICTPVR